MVLTPEAYDPVQRYFDWRRDHSKTITGDSGHTMKDYFMNVALGLHLDDGMNLEYMVLGNGLRSAMKMQVSNVS